MKYILLAIASFLVINTSAADDAKPFIDFLQATAAATAAAKTPLPNAVKFMAFGENETGEVVILSIWLGENKHDTHF